MNDKYSFKDLHFQDFTKTDPKEFEGEIKGTAFSQKAPFTACFSPIMTGVTFTDCNLDNCIIPPGNTVKGGTNKQIKEQADGEMWIVNALLQPVSPLKPYRFDAAGLSKVPAMIPIQAATRIPVSTKPGASTKKIPVTMVKEHKIQEEMKKLVSDPARLMAILSAEGKI